MKLRYSQPALDDLEAIFAFIAESNFRAARSVVTRIEQVAADLADFPFSGQTTDEPEIRMKPVVRFPYLIYYSVIEDDLLIVHVRHTSRVRPWSQS